MLKLTTDKQTNKQTDKQTGQKQYAPDHSIWGHKKIWFQQEGLGTRNTHVKYESSISFGLKVIAKVKFFQK